MLQDAEWKSTQQSGSSPRTRTSTRRSPLAAGRELLTDPAGRFAIYLATGTGPQSATVQRVRLGDDDVADAVAEIRAILRERERTGAEWELGESCTPADLVSRLSVLGIVPDEGEPVAIGMVLEAGQRAAINARRLGATHRLPRRARDGSPTASSRRRGTRVR